MKKSLKIILAIFLFCIAIFFVNYFCYNKFIVNSSNFAIMLYIIAFLKKNNMFSKPLNNKTKIVQKEVLIILLALTMSFCLGLAGCLISLVVLTLYLKFFNTKLE